MTNSIAIMKVAAWPRSPASRRLVIVAGPWWRRGLCGHRGKRFDRLEWQKERRIDRKAVVDEDRHFHARTIPALGQAHKRRRNRSLQQRQPTRLESSDDVQRGAVPIGESAPYHV